MDPCGGSAFDQLDDFAGRNRRGRAEKHVNMIFNPSNLKRVHFVLFGDAADVCMHSLLDVGCEPALAVFRAEDDVVIQRSVGIGHRSNGLETVL